MAKTDPIKGMFSQAYQSEDSEIFASRSEIAAKEAKASAQAAKADAAQALIQANLAADRNEALKVTDGNALNDIAAIYSIPEQDLALYPDTGVVELGKFYLYKRGGVAEVWEAESTIATPDPMNGKFKRLMISAEGSGTEVILTQGTVPPNYVSGPLRLIINGELSSVIFKHIDSYKPAGGDEVIAIDDTILGVIASDQPLMENFCKFYGYPISINSTWNIEEASQFFAQFNGLVFGDKIGNPEHVANADTVAILARVKELNPQIQIFGYVPIGLDPAWNDSNLTLDEIKVRIKNWHDSGATGIFLDEYGYDYFVTRKRQNDCILYCRSLGMNVVANSWSADYCFSNKNIVLSWADNFEGNPNELPCILNDKDYLQFENCIYKYHHEPGTEGYRNPEQWVNNNQRIIDMYEYMYAPSDEYNGRSYFDVYGTKGYALDAIINYDKKMYQESYLVALACGMHAHAASVAFWGAVTPTYPVYEKPNLRASSRVALGKAQPELFADTYVGRLKTQVGPDEIEVTWVQAEPEIKFSEASLGNRLEPKKNIRAVIFPDNVSVVSSGFFTLTLGDSKDDRRTMSLALTGNETREELIDAVANYAYDPSFLEQYDVTKEAGRVVFTSAEPLTEELQEWWVWHTPGAIVPTMDTFTLIQQGSDGKSIEYREVRINGKAVDFGFGPYWRKPRKVNDGYVYFDSTNSRNITYRDNDWYDLNGNKAEDFVETGGVPFGTIIMIAEGKEIPPGWYPCDGQDGRPLIITNPNPTIIKQKPKPPSTTIPLGETYGYDYETVNTVYKLLVYIGDFRTIDDGKPKRVWAESGEQIISLESSIVAVHAQFGDEWGTILEFRPPTEGWTLPEEFNLSFTLANGDKVQGTVVPAGGPDVSITDAKYYYWINSPDSNMTFSFNISGAVVNENIPATVDDGTGSLTAVETNVGLDGRMVLKFRLGDSQSLRRLRNPFVVSVTTYDGEVIEINSNSAEEIQQ